MKIELKQSAVLGGKEYKCNHHGKAIVIDVDKSVKDEQHFKNLLADKMVKIVDIKDAPVKSASKEIDDNTDEHGIEKPVAGAILSKKEKELVLAKAELAELIAKEKPTAADKKRKAVLEKIVAGV